MNSDICKYCGDKLENCTDEGLNCSKCKHSVHIRCLKHKTIPGSLHGDVFFTFTCLECSSNNEEHFKREKLSWLKVVVITLHHLNAKSSGLARKGFFHWRNHIGACVDRNWESLFTSDIKKKKTWINTIAGTLSHFSNFVFTSGTSVINEPAWWSLLYPKLSPYTLSLIYSDFSAAKAGAKLTKTEFKETDVFNATLRKHVQNEDLLLQFKAESICELNNTAQSSDENCTNDSKDSNFTVGSSRKRVSSCLLPTFDNPTKKINPHIDSVFTGTATKPKTISQVYTANEVNGISPRIDNKCTQLLDPMCYYNTSITNATDKAVKQMKTRILGGIRSTFIVSPFSGVHLKPYIRQDTESYPSWIHLMNELLVKANQHNRDFQLPPRAPLNYTYVQPEHIPAINSLCNNFFWPGIDVTDSLQYPDFSCVVLYKRLIVAFAFIVPNVTHTENYISFIFARPGWRNIGIGTFMLYHLIQTSAGKDITMHVAINNPALILYQKFGFKVESVALNFYEKYIRSDVKESKHAFFCRLDR